MILVCRCGQKLNTPGSVPGRVGKCPRCGSLLQMASDPTPEPDSGPVPELTSSVSAGGIYHPARTRSGPFLGRAAWADGMVRIPSAPETTLWGSWNYPLRNASGVGLLAMLPPLLWFGTVPLFALIPLIASRSVLWFFGLILLLPQSLILLVILGHVLVFLGDVVVTSCLGAVDVPRQATWDLTEIAQGWGRWLGAATFGGFVGGLPAVAYWIECGDVDWLDQIVLIDLFLPGLAYAQMAMVVALIHESPWAVAYPNLVLQAIRAGGWDYLLPCVVTAVFFIVLVGLLKACLAWTEAITQVFAFWLWWVLVLYLAIVGMRFLGLFCGRRGILEGQRKQRR